MDIDYEWVIPVCTVVCVFVLAVDITIKNSIIAESVRLREVIEDARQERSFPRTSAQPDTGDRDTGAVVVD